MFAKVIIDNPFLKKIGPISYSISDQFQNSIEIGSLVTVPFRNQKNTAVVVEILEDRHCDLPDLKPILEVSTFKLPKWQIDLAYWISDYYLCPLYKAIKLFLPPNFWKGGFEEKIQWAILPATSLLEIKNYFNKNKTFTKQVALLKALFDKKMLMASEHDHSVMKALKNKGLIRLMPVETITKDIQKQLKLEKHIFTEDQQKIFQDLRQSKKTIHLLYGLSSSGKTEIYLRLAMEYINKGQQVLIIGPELTLIQHLAPYFKSFFPQQFALLHGKISAVKKRSIWHQIQKKQINLIVGSRLALFYPYQNLGLIILDECHEWSYKSDQSPRYHSREIAIEIAKINNIKTVLGTATPDIESYFQSQNNNQWQLHTLEKSHNDFQTQALIADLRDEFHRDNKSVFSEILRQKITTTLAGKEQTLIIINRRGFANTVTCQDCGLTSDCPKCENPFTLYKNQKGNHLFCHHCGKNELFHSACIHCGSISIKELGIGTQKVVQEAQKIFPEAKILQIDGTTIKNIKNLQELQSNLEDADIIIGTQIAAKGFDLKRVTLSCILLADLELNFPDYNSGERAYQLFMQTRGRAGRHKEGLFLIQTYQPEHPIIKAVTASTPNQRSFEKFYEEEINSRKLLDLPPFTKIARLNIKDDNEKTAEVRVKKAYSSLKMHCSERERQNLFSAPDLIYRKMGRYNWHIIIQSPEPQKLILKAKATDCLIDINPNSTI